jgi:hypothetical protein
VRPLLVAVMLALAACSRPPPESTPEGALRSWIEKMESQAGSARPSKDAFALLGPQARASLTERAERASRAQGRRVEAWEMLAQARFGLKFRPATLRATVSGDSAVVDVTGDDPSVDHATVRCARESGVWKVEPELAALPAAQRRPGSERE